MPHQERSFPPSKEGIKMEFWKREGFDFPLPYYEKELASAIMVR
ncbi:MAG: hypothetical protein R6U96_07985 [Promethearchaeia archaeon]